MLPRTYTTWQARRSERLVATANSLDPASSSVWMVFAIAKRPEATKEEGSRRRREVGGQAPARCPKAAQLQASGSSRRRGCAKFGRIHQRLTNQRARGRPRGTGTLRPTGASPTYGRLQAARGDDVGDAIGCSKTPPDPQLHDMASPSVRSSRSDRKGAQYVRGPFPR